jgi:hypothetical protein
MFTRCTPAFALIAKFANFTLGHREDRSGTWEGEDQDPEQHGHDAAQRQQPLASEMTTQEHRRGDLESARHDRPRTNEQHQDQRGDAWPDERENTGHDSGHALEREGPRTAVRSCATEAEYEIGSTVDHCVQTEDDDEDSDRHPWPRHRQDYERPVLEEFGEDGA